MAPLVDPAPGMNFTTTVGLPGRFSDRSGAKKFAHFAEPPVSENGIVHSIVLPLKSTSAWAVAVMLSATAAPATIRVKVFMFSSTYKIGRQQMILQK